MTRPALRTPLIPLGFTDDIIASAYCSIAAWSSPSDSRTSAGVDNIAKFCKMTVFERVSARVLTLLSSGNLAGTQTVISLLRQRAKVECGPINLWTATASPSSIE